MRKLLIVAASMISVALAAGCVDDPLLGMVEVQALTGPEGTTEVALVPARSTWQYHDQGVDLGTTWRVVPPASTWATGDGPLGYGESYVETVISYGDDPGDKHPTAYVRTTFPVDDPARVRRSTCARSTTTASCST
jgi:hypothetical protein